MNSVVYVMRHQKPGSATTNCVHPFELRNTDNLCRHLHGLTLTNVVVTCVTKDNREHMMALQTATNVGTLLNKKVVIFEDTDSLPDYFIGNTLMIGYPSQTNDILKKFGMISSFEWPSDNYHGCITINEYGWEYDPFFFEPKHHWLNSCFLCFLNPIRGSNPESFA
jgi:hypothetical protein